MAATVRTRFDPSRLNTTVTRALPVSVKVAQGDATARLKNHSKSSVGSKIVSPVQGQLIPRGLANVFERGREGGYPITPGGVAGLRKSRSKGETVFKIRGGSGSATFLSSPFLDHPLAYSVGGKMEPSPALAPAARDWAMGGYNRVAKSMLMGAGFR